MVESCIKSTCILLRMSLRAIAGKAISLLKLGLYEIKLC